MSNATTRSVETASPGKHTSEFYIEAWRDSPAQARLNQSCKEYEGTMLRQILHTRQADTYKTVLRLFSFLCIGGFGAIINLLCFSGVYYAPLEVAKSETVIEDEVRENRDFCAYSKSCSIGYETVGDLKEWIVYAGEAEYIHHGPKPSNTEKAEKPYNHFVSSYSMSVWYLSFHRVLILYT